ncbi:MAG: hypothetical protein M1389_08820 [Chloroflexi bacterium]|nr:hypothetical protein [Chloroflexota bacterium]
MSRGGALRSRLVYLGIDKHIAVLANEMTDLPVVVPKGDRSVVLGKPEVRGCVDAPRLPRGEQGQMETDSED